MDEFFLSGQQRTWLDSCRLLEMILDGRPVPKRTAEVRLDRGERVIAYAAARERGVESREASGGDGKPGWRWMRMGRVALTETRAVMQGTGREGDRDYRFDSLHSIDLVATDVLRMAFADDQGRKGMAELHTNLAPLIFVMASVRRFPRHPLLLSGGWLPPRFEEYCRQLGEPCPSVRERVVEWARRVH